MLLLFMVNFLSEDYCKSRLLHTTGREHEGILGEVVSIVSICLYPHAPFNVRIKQNGEKCMNFMIKYNISCYSDINLIHVPIRSRTCWARAIKVERVRHFTFVFYPGHAHVYALTHSLKGSAISDINRVQNIWNVFYRDVMWDDDYQKKVTRA